MEENFICLDIGGTSIKYALAAGGRLREKGSVPTEGRTAGAQGVAEKVLAIVDAFRGRGVAGVAISTLGIVDPVAGKVIYAGPSIKDYTGFALKALVEEATGLSCTVENDVNCAGLGEYWLGAGRGVRSLVCLTVGTDVGASILFNGRLWRGANYSAGEAGSMRLAGGRLGDLASVRRMVQSAAKAHGIAEELDGETVFGWARAGDADAVNAIARLIAPLAEGIANICYMLNPERIVLGGAVMAERQYLAPRILADLEEAVPCPFRSATQLAFAELGNDAGLMGALYHFLQRRRDAQERAQNRETGEAGKVR